MFRLAILLAAIPIIAALFARWYFGTRILSRTGTRQCSCDLNRWEKSFGSAHLPLAEKADAQVYANLLHETTLQEWRTREPKSAASREGARKFGMAVPPLAAIVAILALIVGKIPISGVFAIFLVSTALAVIFAYLSIAPELKAILATSRRLRDTRVFHRSDDENAVIATTKALAWKKVAPPVLNLL